MINTPIKSLRATLQLSKCCDLCVIVNGQLCDEIFGISGGGTAQPRRSSSSRAGGDVRIRAASAATPSLVTAVPRCRAAVTRAQQARSTLENHEKAYERRATPNSTRRYTLTIQKDISGRIKCCCRIRHGKKLSCRSKSLNTKLLFNSTMPLRDPQLKRIN